MTRCWLGLLICLGSCCAGIAADFKTEVREATEAFMPAVARADELLVEGQTVTAREALVAQFRKGNGTPVQAFVLGNILFRMDPQTSYVQHKRAAAQLPTEADPQLEWGMEQHRVREYAGAIDAYEKFCKLQPDFGPAYGLMAECLLRTGKVREAVEAWQKFEQARSSSIEKLESLVCEVNVRGDPYRDRVELLGKVPNGDIDAAERLIVLDCTVMFDWWTYGMPPNYLEHDLELIRKTKFADEARARAVVAAAEVQGTNGEPMLDVLRKSGYLVDDMRTLPDSPQVLALLLAKAESGQALTLQQIQTVWSDQITERAKKSKYGDLWSLVVRFHEDSPKLLEIARQAWEATGEEKFAFTVLMEQLPVLKLSHPDLVKARADFPTSATIATLTVACAVEEKAPLKDVLVESILAEYSRFSLQNPVMPRPGANKLRTYFRVLAGELAKEQKAEKADAAKP